MLAELGTVSLEYLTLARHTKEARYESVVKKIYDSVEKASTWDGMLPTMMRMDTGQPSHGTYTMSGSGDSYYEYLLKNWILTGKKDERYRRLYNAAMEGITKHLLLRSPGSGLLYTGEGEKNAVGDSMGHLACFTGGMIALGVLHKVNPATSERDLKNAKALAQALMDKGYTICTGGTDNHLILWDVRPLGLTGSKIEKVCDLINISLNKNTVHGDKSAQSPGGVRIGTPALTTRGLKEADFQKVAGFLDRAVKICLDVQKSSGKKLKDFVAALPANKDIPVLAHDVATFATSFPMPGFDTETMKYKNL